MNELHLIGQFAALAGISSRMLRHYDKLGLIEPDRIDELTGYRYYDDNQLPIIKTIIALQHYGFSLSEIKKMMSSEITTDAFTEMLGDKEIILRQSIDVDTGYLLNIRKTISYLNQKNQQPGLNEKINLKHLNLERSYPMTLSNSPQPELLAQLKEKVLTLPSTSLFTEQVEDYLNADFATLKHYITFDLDKFAPVNDLYGFDVGDLVIFKSMAFMLNGFKSYLDNGKAIACRFGGDEMVFFLSDAPKDIIQIIVTNVLEDVRNFDWSTLGCDQKMTSSCGIYGFTKCNNINEPRHNSAKAFMEAKKLGGNQLVTITQ